MRQFPASPITARQGPVIIGAALGAAVEMDAVVG